MTIKESIQQLAKTNDRIYSIVGIVKNVDNENNLCDIDPVDDNLPELFEVEIPPMYFLENETQVIVSFMGKNEGFITGIFESPAKYSFKNESENLKDLIQDLISNQESLYEAIQALTVTASSFGAPTTFPNNIASFISGKAELTIIKNRFNDLLH